MAMMSGTSSRWHQGAASSPSRVRWTITRSTFQVCKKPEHKALLVAFPLLSTSAVSTAIATMKGPISHRRRQRCGLQTKRLQPFSRGFEAPLFVASAANVGRDKFLFPASADGVKSHVANVCPVGPLSSRRHYHCGLFCRRFFLSLSLSPSSSLQFGVGFQFFC